MLRPLITASQGFPAMEQLAEEAQETLCMSFRIFDPETRLRGEGARARGLETWADLLAGGEAGRLLAVVFLGTLAFNMQDILLEPYGGEILGLSVSATTLLTAIWAAGALAGFALAGRALTRGRDAMRMAGSGMLAGIAAFCVVIFAAPMQAPALFFAGAGLIGFGGGLFAVSTLLAAMRMPATGRAGHGLALGAWGAAQATGAGLAIALVLLVVGQGVFGPTLSNATVETVGADGRGSALGLQQSAGALGRIIGPLLAEHQAELLAEIGERG